MNKKKLFIFICIVIAPSLSAMKKRKKDSLANQNEKKEELSHPEKFRHEYYDDHEKFDDAACDMSCCCLLASVSLAIVTYEIVQWSRKNN